MDLQREKPPEWRIGQTLFNFLEWCRVQGSPENRPAHYRDDNTQSHRMADPFNWPDISMERLWRQYLRHLAETRQGGMRFG